METLEESRMCRLCGKSSGIAIDIFDKKESHVRKINAILPILVHEMDLLPKQMCHRCSYKLEEFYNFYVECAKTDSELKSQLCWMRKENLEEKIITPMVKMNRFKIKTEPPDPEDSDNVFGKFSENPLIFPASILHSYDFNTSPMLTCSRCRCICNENININKQSPKEVKELSKEMENLPHCSDATADVSKKSCESLDELSEPNIINKLNINKDTIEDNSLREKNIQETPTASNDIGTKPTKVNGLKILRSETLNRALRPRRGSVDYMGQKKKDLASNIKVRVKNKLDMLSPSVVKPANMKMTQTNMMHSGPIIKLEKVDDAMKTLRVRKNLEEFNRRIKEYQRNRNQETLNETHNRRHFRKDDIFSKKSQEEDQIRKHLRKEEKQRRKSLHKQENVNVKSTLTDIPLGKKSFQKNESSNKNLSEKSLPKDVNIENLEKDSNENIRKTTESQIKQETLIKATQINEVPEVITLQETTCEVDTSKEVRIQKPEDRLTFNAVVKLEKDYTCNVDYPRIKIKRHLPTDNSSMINSTSEADSMKRNKECSASLNPKSVTKDASNISPKHLRSEKKKLRNFVDKYKRTGRVTKTKIKRKGMSIVKVKRPVLEIGSSSSAAQADFIKYYCDECDNCFRNKELYKLHPCYQ